MVHHCQKVDLKESSNCHAWQIATKRGNLMKLFAHCLDTKVHLWNQQIQKIQHRNPPKSRILDSVLCSIHPMKWPPVTAVPQILLYSSSIAIFHINYNMSQILKLPRIISKAELPNDGEANLEKFEFSSKYIFTFCSFPKRFMFSTLQSLPGHFLLLLRFPRKSQSMSWFK